MLVTWALATPGWALAASPAENGPAVATAAATDLGNLLSRIGAKEGSVAFADLAGGSPKAYSTMSTPYAWSSIKTVIVATLLGEVGGPSGMSAAQRSLATRAITASDNAAAMSLFATLKSRHGGTTAGAAAAMQRLLRKAGDSQTVVSTVGRDGFSPYGQTLWTPASQARFVASLARGCLVNRASTDYLLGLMRSVVAGQRWGIGTLGRYPFKGGWGPDRSGGYLVRQIGLIRPQAGGGLVAVAIAVRPRNGSFTSGASQISAVAAWARQHAPRGATTRRCGS